MYTVFINWEPGENRLEPKDYFIVEIDADVAVKIFHEKFGYAPDSRFSLNEYNSIQELAIATAYERNLPFAHSADKLQWKAIEPGEFLPENWHWHIEALRQDGGPFALAETLDEFLKSDRVIFVSAKELEEKNGE